mmetsp:Transcript_23287/g.57599  ORF Transcript_23287/g.57599 Transcript_23287/m.57599 type:complete len:214 (+) Transcript_23287:241-882(+)
MHRYIHATQKGKSTLAPITRSHDMYPPDTNEKGEHVGENHTRSVADTDTDKDTDTQFFHKCSQPPPFFLARRASRISLNLARHSFLFLPGTSAAMAVHRSFTSMLDGCLDKARSNACCWSAVHSAAGALSAAAGACFPSACVGGAACEGPDAPLTLADDDDADADGAAAVVVSSSSLWSAGASIFLNAPLLCCMNWLKATWSSLDPIDLSVWP